MRFLDDLGNLEVWGRLSELAFAVWRQIKEGRTVYVNKIEVKRLMRCRTEYFRARMYRFPIPSASWRRKSTAWMKRLAGETAC